jgi:serine protease Do
MNASTNSLVAKAATIARRFAVPTGVAAALLLAGAFAINHNAVHASSTAVTLDDSSVSPLEALDRAIETVAARVTPAVVNVEVTSHGSAEQMADGQMNGMPPGMSLPPGFEQFFGQGNGRRISPQQQFEHGVGSGIIISPDGYIVTNNHVVEGAVQMKVTLDDRRVLNARLIGTDKLTDLAVIKVNATDLPYLTWGDSNKLHPGQTVLAFGSPFGSLRFSVTRGIVSAINRANPNPDDLRKPGGFIQTDAAINPGNSGGPLVNARGEVIGVNTSILTSSGSFAGAGFAIPAQIARATAEELIKSGSVHHGYLGISMNDVTPDNSSFFNLPDAAGAIVAQVTPDSPAGRAGLKSGDVIRKLNGDAIENGGALQVAVSQIAPGKTINLGIIRDGKPETISIKVGEFHGDREVAENSNPDGKQGGKFGLAVDNITPDIRQQLNLPENVKGVAVENVRPASPAEDAGLSPGDVILEINRHPVESADKFVGEVHSVPAGKDILLLVWSRGNASYRVLRADPSNQNGM